MKAFPTPFLSTICALLLPILGSSQIVSLSPANAGPDDAVTLIFDATQGNAQLATADQVYMHHGVVTNSPTGTSWSYVIGNWGQDDGIGEMEPVPGEPGKWQMVMSPSVRAHYSVPAGENIFRISAVFRSADGSVKGTIAAGSYPWGNVTSSGDFFINLNVPDYANFVAPSTNETFLNAGQSMSVSANASAAVSQMQLWVDEGSGYSLLNTVSSGTSISATYFPTVSGLVQFKVTATINGNAVEAIKSHSVVLIQATQTEALPAGLRPGINYDPNDASHVHLVLEAPGKTYAFAVGDFSNWLAWSAYQMKKTPDDRYFWTEIVNLTPNQDYVFQYWVNGNVKIGDPYATQVADPWNDSYIEPEVFPNIPAYSRTDLGLATVLRTGETPYVWGASENSWVRPSFDHAVVYELHLRDFLESHSFNDLADTLSYLKRLGITAVELMPVNEFDGNDSWGYNPAYHFAVDKYYGTKDDLKHFIEVAHSQGLAVILDFVLNHAFGNNPLVKLYWNSSTGKPAADNPWFNVNAVGPYSWGYDFNHESPNTQAYVDSVNGYWMREFHIDGIRFDFTKGFTNYAPGGNIDGYDASRIAILNRMADHIQSIDPQFWIILEHWGTAAEEVELSQNGMYMWKNRSYDFVPSVTGTLGGNFAGMDNGYQISYSCSHDEQRLNYHAKTEGAMSAFYNIREAWNRAERIKTAAAFTFLFPGPKMLWQFDELGYDIDINYNGRTGRKPLPWGANGLGYYEDPMRQTIYNTFKVLLELRDTLDPVQWTQATTGHLVSGPRRRIVYNTNTTDLVVLGSFDVQAGTIAANFPQTGTWYDYFSGDSISVSDVSMNIGLQPGELRVYTSNRLSNGFPGLIVPFDNPVTITPYPFRKDDPITIRFDATKAWTDGTAGLVNAATVYLHSGAVSAHPDSISWDFTTGNLQNDGLGQMTEVSDNIWEIAIVPSTYYNSADTDLFRLGMWFHNGDNTLRGKGYRDANVYFDVESDLPIITVTPPDYAPYQTITVRFNARAGNRELMGAETVYMHSSVGTVDTQSPATTAWNNAVGNWGNDDGVGEMQPVAGEDDVWEISLVPQTYYSLTASEFPYWLAAVFRNATGTVKGTASPGTIENGFIAANYDIFVKNQGFVGIAESATPNWDLYPNPSEGWLYFHTPSAHEIQVYTLAGSVVYTAPAGVSVLDLRALAPGMYILKSGNAGVQRVVLH